MPISTDLHRTERGTVSMLRRLGGLIAVSFLLGWPTALRAGIAATVHERGLSFEDRVVAQRKIEQVYWSHRIWPTENPGPKPSLDAVLPSAQIRAKVEDYLKKSNALEAWWGRPITRAQLQAELDRMAAQSRAPEVLREVFEALGNDPLVIAETLARPAMADRLIHSWYSRDKRFHADARSKAAAALAGVSNGEQLAALATEYAETTWRLDDRENANGGRRAGEIALDARAWRERFGNLEELPLMTVSPLREDDAAFFVSTVLKKGADSVTVGTAWWPKTPFDGWWSEHEALTSSELAGSMGEFVLPEVTAASSCAPDTWRVLPEIVPPPIARYGHTAVWTGIEMIVWGGVTDGGAALNTGGRYTPATGAWVETSTSSVPSVRQDHTAVWTGSEMVVWGGYDPATSVTNTGGRYAPSTNSWIAMTTANAPSARLYHTAAWTGGEMIVWGGAGQLDGNTGGRYTPSTDHWVATTTTGAPAARYSHTAVWTGAEMIIWGGLNDEGTSLNTGGRYRPASDSWAATRTSQAPTARNSHTAVWTGAEMIAWGGRSGSTYFDTGGRYNPSTDRWVSTTTTGAPTARGNPTSVWTGGRMVVWGGRSGSTFFDSGGRYDPSTNGWLPTTTTGAPAGRVSHCTVWSGSEMIVWGGLLADSIDSDSGGRYDPSADSWLPMSTVPGSHAPALSGHSAVWTGSEMIVWGAIQDMGIDVNTGARYNPATDSWAEMSTPAIPGRWNHTAVWTGSEMIVWGGMTASGPSGPRCFNSGARYSPATNGWVPTATNGAAAGRESHTAVWTGSEMIVWGGNYYVVTPFYLNTGGRYNPSTDGWLAMTSDGAPSARGDQTAVWTGREMLVWGGRNLTTYLDTGGRYDPSADRWVSTTTAAAPAARADHAAVWTGSTMIAWGGMGAGSTYFATGGRYDPTTDGWLATSTTGAPDARIDHTVVWTGDEMIVWGGRRGTYFATGGRYNPLADGWVATSSAGVPAARYGHTAIWTGNKMMVWGGSNGTTTFDAGSSYCVSSCDSPATWYQDADDDGFGIASVQQLACARPAGFAVVPGDCDDGVATCSTECVSDVDADSVRDCEDTCLDIDGDGYGSSGGAGNTCVAADNCPSVANVFQLDTDADLVGDACDCAWNDPGKAVLLGPARDLRFASRIDLAWNPPVDDGGGALSYDLLRTAGVTDWQDPTCLATGTTATAASDTETPTDAFFYLVRVRSACGENVGTASTEQRRQVAACVSP